MIDRCTRPTNSHWSRYGGRGIKVCERWLRFENFLADMGPKPSIKHTIERLNVDGHYEQGNCVWALQKQQMRNMSRNRSITIGDRTMLLCDWCEETGMSSGAILRRISRGWSEEEAVLVPPGGSDKPRNARRGEGQHSAKLTEDDVREMRDLRGKGWTYNELAKRFDIVPTNASLICARRTWRHVE